MPSPDPESARPPADSPGSAGPEAPVRNPRSAEYRVELDAYAGPLDLLLYLVKRHEIDLGDIPMAKLTEQYLAHLKIIESLPGPGGGVDVDRAGEFLVMAATLVEIKSAMLMPKLEAEQAEEQDDPAAEANVDPRFELVQQLLAYKRFKDVSLALERRQVEWDQRFPAGAKAGKPKKPSDAEDDAAESSAPVELDLEDVNIMDLCAAFGRMLDSIGFTGDHEVTYDDTPISLHADDIADRLERDGVRGGMTLRELFIGRKSRSEMIGLFLATLELVRQRRVTVIQPPVGGDIRLEIRPEADRNDLDDTEDHGPRDWTDPETGEIDYDWPDEESRQRAERRAKLRAAYAAKGQTPPEVDDEEGDDTGPAEPVEVPDDEPR